MFTYRGSIDVPDWVPRDVARAATDMVCEVGEARRHGPRAPILFEVKADDLWDLAWKLAGIEQQLETHGITYKFDRENVTEEW